MPKAAIGLIGLAVMGENLALNIARNGFPIAVYNRTGAVTEKYLAGAAKAFPVTGAYSIEEFVNSLEQPRRIIIMVKAGAPVDSVLGQIRPLLSAGDIIMDCGNSYFVDTERRSRAFDGSGINYFGVGVSGGEEGALKGPSIMPGGPIEAYDQIAPILTKIAAQVSDGACVSYLGSGAAGHYVKMVHNGIEYGDMQMICEAYALMQGLLGLKAAEMGAIFSEWNAGALDSFLIEITADILKQKDPLTKKKAFVDIVLDTAGQKGTGKWTSTNALDMGVPAPTIAESVFARCISAIKEERVAASKILQGPSKKYRGSKKALVQAIHDALYCSKICSYAQGFQLMRTAQKEYNWTLNFGEIAQIWRGGCIIRAAFLQKITEAYARNPHLANLLLDPYFNKMVKRAQENWRKVVSLAAECGVAAPTFSSALSYYDSYRSARLPANLLQAQRDYFGAHTYERTDQPRGKFYHIDWPEASRPQLEA